jgi:hypothetical protein
VEADYCRRYLEVYPFCRSSGRASCPILTDFPDTFMHHSSGNVRLIRYVDEIVNVDLEYC